MTADPLRDLFGPAPSSDPLADVFGTAPNEDFARGNPLEHQDSGLGRALRGGAEPQHHFSVGDLARSAAAGAVSSVSMGVRGLGEGLARTRDLFGKAAGMDQASTDAFFQHWLAPDKLGQGPLGFLSLLTPGFTTATTQAGQQVQNVADTVNVAPEKQNQVGNIVANATGQLAGLIAISAVGGEGAVDSSLLGQGFDQIDQSLKQGGEKKGGTVSGDIATLIGGPVTAVIEKTGLDAVLEGVPLPIRNRVLRGLADTMLVGGYEAGEEVAQQIVQNFATKLGLDPHTPVRDWPKGLTAGLEPNAVGGFGAGFIARAVVGRWGAHRPVARPMGLREQGALAPEITPEDEASPLPTDLIVQGKMTIGAADGTTKANQVLRASGIPDVGTRVTVSHNGKQQHGAIADAWTVNVAGQDSVGVKIKLDDGTMIEEPVDTLRDMGVTITPVALPSGLPEQDLANPVVQQFAGRAWRRSTPGNWLNRDFPRTSRSRGKS
jgi:hypothetical protein